jgi:hypothetical protein
LDLPLRIRELLGKWPPGEAAPQVPIIHRILAKPTTVSPPGMMLNKSSSWDMIVYYYLVLQRDVKQEVIRNVTIHL